MKLIFKLPFFNLGIYSDYVHFFEKYTIVYYNSNLFLFLLLGFGKFFNFSKLRKIIFLSLPKKKKKLVILRSPHIYSKSKESYTFYSSQYFLLIVDFNFFLNYGFCYTITKKFIKILLFLFSKSKFMILFTQKKHITYLLPPKN